MLAIAVCRHEHRRATDAPMHDTGSVTKVDRLQNFTRGAPQEEESSLACDILLLSPYSHPIARKALLLERRIGGHRRESAIPSRHEPCRLDAVLIAPEHIASAVVVNDTQRPEGAQHGCKRRLA